jgi:hypothetical protein
LSKPAADAPNVPELVIERVELKYLKRAPYNPRKISDVALAALEKSVARFGYVEPIIWNKRSGYIVGGHQRLTTLERKNVDAADVVVVDLSPTEEKALNVTLNSPTVEGVFTDGLQAILDEIAHTEIDLFEGLRLGELYDKQPAAGESPEQFKSFDESIETKYCCPKCKYRWSGNPNGGGDDGDPDGE